MRRKKINFEGGILPIYIANQILGMRFIEYPRGEIRYYFSCFYSMVVVAILLLGRFLRSSGPEDSGFEKWVLTSMEDLDLATTIGIIGFGHYTSESFYSFKKQAAYVEKEFLRLGSPIDCDRLYKCSLVCLILWIAYIIIGATAHVLLTVPSMPLWLKVMYTVPYYLRESIGTLVLIDFMASIMWLKLGFQQINRLLELGLPDGWNDKFGGSDRSKSIDKVLAVLENPNLDLHSQMFVGDSFKANGISGLARRSYCIREKRLHINSIRQAHLKLCTTAKSIYTLFNIPVSLRVALVLMFTIGRIFYMYMRLVYETLLFQVPLLFGLYIVECVSEVVKLGLVCVVCEYTLREINQSKALIYTLDWLEDNFELKDDIHQFGLQMAICQQGLICYGLSYMSFAFVRKCISSVTTYLVIMIQMGQAARSHAA